MLEKSKIVSRRNEALCVGLTLLRLVAAERMARQVAKRQGIGKSLIAFIIADIADGVLARKLDADTPLRRFTDAAVDRLSVLRVGWSVAKINKAAKPHMAILAAREILVTGVNATHTIRTGEIVQGNSSHKLSSLSTALFAMAASSGNETLTHSTGIAMNAINISLAADYVANLIEPSGYESNGVRHIASNG